MIEQKFEQEQTPQTPGKKILLIVGPENEEQISQALPKMLESCGIHGKRIIYNNLRTKDEFPGWETPDNRTEAELMQQAHRLSAGDCYVLDYLQLVRFSTDMVTYLSMGKALLDVASSRGADCLIICFRRSEKVAKALKKTRIYDWLQVLMEYADIVLQDDALEKKAGNELIEMPGQGTGEEQTQGNYELPQLELLSRDEEDHDSNFVDIRSILESDEWRNCNAEIPLILGKDPKGKNVIIDLALAPHILMAGSTGSGKSVCMDTMIMSLLFRFRPDELKFILFDPKLVEFEKYNDLPHLLTPVINDSEKFPFALRWAADELARRFHVMSDAGVRNIRDFNAHSHDNRSHEYMPIIVIIIDELSDLMKSDARRDVEELIVYIAQRGRTAGIHLIISTQCPSKSVFPSIIKANFPTRICFRVSSQKDSRLVLDNGGAEILREPGNMICKANGSMNMKRIQGARTADKDILHVVHFAAGQMVPQFNHRVICAPQKEYVCNSSLEEARHKPEYAPLLKKNLQPYDPPMALAALALLQMEGRINTIFLQRCLEIGYDQAASLIELLEERGIIRLSPEDGPKCELLISADCDTRGE